MLGLLVIAACRRTASRARCCSAFLATAAIAWVFGLSHFSRGLQCGDLSAAAFKLDIRQALNLKGGLGLSLLEIVFVFLFVTCSTISVRWWRSQEAGLIAPDGSIRG